VFPCRGGQGASGQGPAVQTVFEDGFHVAVTEGAQGQGPAAGLLQSVSTVGFSQSHDSQATAETLLGMGTGGKDGFHQAGG